MLRLAPFLLLLQTILAAQAPPAEAPSLPDWVKAENNIAYDRHKETVLDVLQPSAPVKGLRPGVIVIHGGGWTGGTKEDAVQSVCLPYLEKGFVVANVEYRLAKVATAPAAVNDVLRASQWFFQNAKKYHVDTKRIIVTGGSAGGHLTLMVGMTPRSAKLGPPAKVAAVVNVFGITDVADQLSGPNMRQYAVLWVPEQAGRLELARRVSPMTYVRAGLPPILTLHGDADQTVPYEHGARLTKALQDKGVDAQLITVAGGQHGFPKEKWNELYPQIFTWLKSHGILRD
jgi:acetyl esterase/lipase